MYLDLNNGSKHENENDDHDSGDADELMSEIDIFK